MVGWFDGCHQRLRPIFSPSFFCVVACWVLLSLAKDTSAFHSTSSATNSRMSPATYPSSYGHNLVGLVPSQVLTSTPAGKASTSTSTSKASSNPKTKAIPKTTKLQLVPPGKANSNNDVTSSCLIPSQVKGVSLSQRQKQPKQRSPLAAVTPENSATVVSTQSDATPATKDSMSTNKLNKSSNGHHTKNPRRRRQQSPRPAVASATSENENQNVNGGNQKSSTKPSNKKKNKKNLRPPRAQRSHSRFGNLPDTHWYAPS